jgi:HAD superfamily hydrolase (TIGR01509 family)
VKQQANISKLFKKLPEFSAVILDLDGLVLDTESTYFRAWQLAAQDLGYHFSDTFCTALSGQQYADVEQHILTSWGAEFPLDQFRTLSSEHWRRHVRRQGIAVKNGVFELLDVLAACELTYCLATNSRHTNALECLQFAGLGNVFSMLISRDQVDAGKPAADIFIQAAKQLSVNLSACIVVEDSLIGIQAAHEAGIFSVLIPSATSTNTQATGLCSMKLDDLSVLAKIIRFKFRQQFDDEV